MTRVECETKIAAHVDAIIEILKEYNPECQYLAFGYTEQDGRTSYFFNNEHWGKDAERPVDFYKQIGKEIM